MSIEDEIAAKAKMLEEEKRKQAEEEQKKKRMDNALQAAGMIIESPVMMVPSPDLKPVITETLTKMQFTNPKIVRLMPNGEKFVRETREATQKDEKAERPDAYSFDVLLYETPQEKGREKHYMWVFNNGDVAFACAANYRETWSSVKSHEITPEVIRSLIIEALALQSMQKGNRTVPGSSNETSNETSNGCYIATAVYGSYNCPEVWVLRRYRDLALKSTVLGRLFVKSYYAISPTLVKWFGEKRWFISPWRKFLDKKVAILKKSGYSDKEYKD